MLTNAISFLTMLRTAQTSDVRQQLLGHLGDAAAKASSQPSKTGGFLSGDTNKSGSGALTNVCAALLGSLQQVEVKYTVCVPTLITCEMVLADARTSVQVSTQGRAY